MSRDDDSQGRKPYAGPTIEPAPRIGTPTKYCYRRHDKVCELIRSGLSRESAAYGSGVSPATIYSWMQSYPEFLEDVKKADADFEESIVANIKAASHNEKTWQAGAWLLERKNPRRWGRNAIQEQDPGDEKKDHWQLKTRIPGKRYLVVDIGDTDPVTAYHESKEHADTDGAEPTEPDA